MKCEELKDLFELYALGLLEPAEKEQIDEHLGRECQTCQKSLKDALAVNAMFMSHAPEVVPPSRLKRRVLAGVGVERSSWSWLWALAAACMLVVALWVSVQERQRTTELAQARQSIIQINAERDRLEQALAFLNQPETQQVNFGRDQPTPPRGKVFVHERLGVLFIASNLPQVPAGRTYEMWVIPKGANAAPRPAGLFQSTGQGTAMHMLSGPVDAANLAAVAISVEPESGSPAPTTTPIVIAPIAGV